MNERLPFWKDSSCPLVSSWNLPFRDYPGLNLRPSWIFQVDHNFYKPHVKILTATRFFLLAILFFNRASVLLNFFLNWSSNVAYVLLITYKHHYTERHISYLVYFGPCLGLGLFMSHIGDLFFIFSLIFIVISSITSWKQTHLFYAHFLDYLLLLLDDNVDEESK